VNGGESIWIGLINRVENYRAISRSIFSGL
jgi:hypothetical protein